jgi:hypothetical protein
MFAHIDVHLISRVLWMEPKGTTLYKHGRFFMYTFLTDAIILTTYLVSDYPELIGLADHLFTAVLDLTKINNKYRLKEALKLILINLYNGFVKGRAVRYSRDKTSYKCGTRYTELWFKYDRIKSIVDALKELEYVNYKDGIYYPGDNVHFQSRMWASKKLIDLFYEFQFQKIKYIKKSPPKEIIQLKERKEKINGKKIGGRWIDYTDNHKTETMRYSLYRYNKFIDEQDIQVVLSGDVPVNWNFLLKRKSNIVSLRIEIIKFSTDADTIFKIDDKDKEYAGYTIGGFQLILADENFPAADKDTHNTFIDNNIHNSTINQYFTHYINNKYISYSNTLTQSTHKHLSMTQSETLESLANPPFLIPSTTTIEGLETKRPLSEYGIYQLNFRCNHQFLHRVFVKYNDFSWGGRFYGAVHEDLPKEVRPHIVINGSPTTEFDFSAHHVRLLYALKGISYEDKDPYEECCKSMDERPILKKIILIAINAKDEPSAIRAAIKELKDDGFKGACLKHYYIRDCINRFKEHHPIIAGYLHKDRGISLQCDDSHITDEILYQMVSKKIPVLPVHDSYIVPREHADTLRAVMVDAYKKKIGKEFTPVIK